MHYMNAPYTLNNASTTSTAAIDASYLAYISVQAVFSDGAAAGALKLQGSNDLRSPTNNWNDVPSTSQTVASGATTLVPRTEVAYRWLRVTFVSSAGSGTIALTVYAQGF